MNRIVNIALYSIVFTLAFNSCSEEIKDDLPIGIIEKQDFKQVLLDIQLVESHINEARVNQPIIRDSANNYFMEVYNKHNISEIDFQTTMNYYTARPGELQEIYSEVLNELSEMEAALSDVKLDQEAVAPIGKHEMADIISHTSIAPLYLDTTFTPEEIKDSLFKYFLNNDSILKHYNTNLISLQKSYSGMTFKENMYNSLKEDIKKKLENSDNK